MAAAHARAYTRPADVGYSLAATRAHHEHRAVVAGTTMAGLATALQGIADGRPPMAGTVAGRVPGSAGKVALVFPGQGSQHAGMGAGLYRQFPAFAAHVRECAAVMDPLLGWPLAAVIRQDPGAPPLERPEVVQPALFTVMTGLAALLAHYGITPARSPGTPRARSPRPTWPGILPLEDAATLITARASALMHALAGTGAMAALAATPQDLGAATGRGRAGCHLAAVNSPADTVISGDDPAVAAAPPGPGAAGAPHQALGRLRLPLPPHGRAAAPLRQAAGRLAHHPPHTPLVCALTGHPAGPGTYRPGRPATGQPSLRQHRSGSLMRPRAQLAGGATTLCEAGPAAVLSAAITATLPAPAPGGGHPCRQEHQDQRPVPWPPRSQPPTPMAPAPTGVPSTPGPGPSRCPPTPSSAGTTGLPPRPPPPPARPPAG